MNWVLKTVTNWISFDNHDKFSNVKTDYGEKFKKIDIEDLRERFGFVTVEKIKEFKESDDSDKYKPTFDEEEANYHIEELTKKLSMQEMEITKEREYWRNTFNMMPDPIFIIDNNYNIIHANFEFMRMIGLPYEKIIKKKCFDILPIKKETLTEHTSDTSSMPLSMAVDKIIINVDNVDYILAKNPLTFNGKGDAESFIIVVLNIHKLKKEQKDVLIKQRAIDTVGTLCNLLNKDKQLENVVDHFLSNIIELFGTDFACIISLNHMSKKAELTYYATETNANKLEGMTECGSIETEEFLKLFENKFKINRETSDLDLVINSESFSFRDLETLFKMGFSSLLASPISVKDKIWGYVCTCNSLRNLSKRDIWQKYEITIMMTLSSILSSFIIGESSCECSIKVAG